MDQKNIQSVPAFVHSMDLLRGEEAYTVQSRADELAAQGKSLVRLEIGQPDILTPRHIIESAVDALHAGKVRYTAPLGMPELRAAVADHVTKTRNVRVTPEMVGITPSAKTGIFLSMLATIEKGDEVIYPDPGYPIYEDAIRFLGAVPKPISFIRNNGFGLNIDEFERTLNERTKLIILNSPSNPLGSIISRETLARIAAILDERKLASWILSDEIYSRFMYDGLDRAPSIYSERGMAERTLLVDGFSKIYSMTGWRLGFVIFPERCEYAMDKLFVDGFGCVSTFIQCAGVSALTESQDSVKTMVTEFGKRRDFIVSALNNISGITCENPQGAFYVFPNIKGLGKSSAEVARDLLEKEGVALLPGTAFGPQGEGFLRISFATSLENLAEGARRIQKYATSLLS